MSSDAMIDAIRAALSMPLLSEGKCREVARAVLESEWMPMSQLHREVGEPVIVCQPGATDHYAVAEWGQGYDDDADSEVYAWRDNVFGEIIWTEENMAEAFRPALLVALDPRRLPVQNPLRLLAVVAHGAWRRRP